MEIAVGVSLLSGLGALLLSALAFRLARRSSPERLRVDIAALREAIITCEIRCETSESRIAQHATQNAAVLEELEGVLQSVEKKRRQTTAAASKIDQATAVPAEVPVNVEELSRHDLRLLARSRGF